MYIPKYLDHPECEHVPLRSRPNLHQPLRWLFLWARWKATFIHFCMLSHYLYLSILSLLLSHTHTFFLFLSLSVTTFFFALSLSVDQSVCLSVRLSLPLF